MTPAQYRLLVETEYIYWEISSGTFSNEMYPVLTYAIHSATYKGNVPNKMGRIYCEVECNSLCREAMIADPEVEIVGEQLIEELEVV